MSRPEPLSKVYYANTLNYDDLSLKYPNHNPFGRTAPEDLGIQLHQGFDLQ